VNEVVIDKENKFAIVIMLNPEIVDLSDRADIESYALQKHDWNKSMKMFSIKN
jgi:hypothetical protein